MKLPLILIVFKKCVLNKNISITILMYSTFFVYYDNYTIVDIVRYYYWISFVGVSYVKKNQDNIQYSIGFKMMCFDT